MKMELIEGSETLAISIVTPGNYPKENILHTEHGKSLKSRIIIIIRRRRRRRERRKKKNSDNNNNNKNKNKDKMKQNMLMLPQVKGQMYFLSFDHN